VVVAMIPHDGWRWLLLAIWAARRGQDAALAASREQVALQHHLPPALGQQVAAALPVPSFTETT